MKFATKRLRFLFPAKIGYNLLDTSDLHHPVLVQHQLANNLCSFFCLLASAQDRQLDTALARDNTAVTDDAVLNMDKSYSFY